MARVQQEKVELGLAKKQKKRKKTKIRPDYMGLGAGKEEGRGWGGLSSLRAQMLGTYRRPRLRGEGTQGI